jgi:hypothetical protein
MDTLRVQGNAGSTSHNPNMLLQEDQWVGEAITHARIAYECWSGLVSGMFKIAPESSPNLLGGSYVNVFADYSKKEFLRYVSVFYRGFFKEEKGVRGKRKDAIIVARVKRKT